MASKVHTLPPVPRDRQILQAASELFFEHGFNGTSVSAIGRRAGVTGPAIYSHFKGKDEILATLCLEAIDALVSGLGEPTDDPRADLDTLIVLHTRRILSDRRLASVYVRESRSLAPSFHRLIERQLERYVRRWVETLARCWPERDIAEVASAANAAMGLVNSVVLWPENAFATPGLDTLLIAMVRRAVSVLDDELLDQGEDGRP